MRSVVEESVSACLEEHLTATARQEIKVLRARMATIHVPFREVARVCWRVCMPIAGLRYQCLLQIDFSFFYTEDAINFLHKSC